MPRFRCGEDSRIDVVVLVDTSFSLEDDRERSVLAATEVLRPLAVCGRLRLGVLTSDLGAGARPSSPCSSAGDGARLLPLGPGMAAYVEGEPDELGVHIRNAIVARPVGCGFEQPLRAVRRFLLSPQFVAFDRPGAPNILLYITEEDDCSALDPDTLFDPTGPYGTIGRNELCYIAGEDAFVDERELAEGIVSASPDRLGLGIVAGFEPDDIGSTMDPDGLRALADRYASRPTIIDRTCGDEAVAPVRLTRFAAELERLGAAASIDSICSPRGTLGQSLVDAIGAR